MSKQYLVSLKVQRGDLSLLMPQVFGEVLLRVYTKEFRFVLYCIHRLDVLPNAL